MKTVGIVSEYNPFHNGHKFHISETKKQLNIDCVVTIMSSNFTQRGDVAIFDMYKRALVACENGVDLVLSIPPQFVLNSAQYYAYNSVYILNSIGGIDFLSFGSECGDIDLLKKAIHIDKEKLKENLDMGMTYAKAVSSIKILNEPNNILGVEYLRALEKLNSSIEPFTIKRNKVLHNDEFSVDEFSSASFIRNLIKNNQDYSKFVPKNCDYHSPTFDNDVAKLISYKLNLGDKDDFENILNISEGLNNRILKAKDSKTMDEFIENIKCKRYTETRIRRALYSILLDLEKRTEPPTYTRVLAMTKTGQQFLNNIKKTSKIKLFSKITKKDIYENEQLKKELICNNIYKNLT